MVTCWSDGQLFRPPRCRYRALVRFRGTGVTEYSARIASDHSALMPADLMTLPHFSVSSAMSLPKSAGDPAWTRNPRSSYLALISGRARDALISLLSTSMYSSARRGNRAASQFRKHLPSTSVLGSSGESRAILTKHSRRWTLNGTVSNTEVGKQPGV